MHLRRYHHCAVRSPAFAFLMLLPIVSRLSQECPISETRLPCSIPRNLEGTFGSQRVTIRRHTSIPLLTGLFCTDVQRFSICPSDSGCSTGSSCVLRHSESSYLVWSPVLAGLLIPSARPALVSLPHSKRSS